MRTITGKKFNKENNKYLVKLLNEDCIHNDLEIKLGYNINFQQNITFIAFSEYKKHINVDIFYICDITIPDDATVVVEKNEYSANMIIINNKKRYGHDIPSIKKQTPELCLAAVKENGLALQFVKNKTAKICLEAVKQNRDAIKYVKDTTIHEFLEYYLKDI